METETVIANDDELKIRVAPLTLVFANSVSTHYPDRLMLDPEMTLKHFREIQEIGPYTIALFKLAVPDFREEITLENMRKAHIGFQHLIGLLELSFNYTCIGRKFGWKYPETYLHPRHQGNLADIAILLSNLPKLREFILRIKKEKGI